MEEKIEERIVKVSEAEGKRKRQVEQQVDELEDATGTLLKRLDELDTRLLSVLRDRSPISAEIKQQGEDESWVSLALVLHSFSLRVEEANDRVCSIMDRLEL